MLFLARVFWQANSRGVVLPRKISVGNNSDCGSTASEEVMNGPLTRADLQKASQHVYELTVNRDRIDKLEKTGADVAELRARNEHALGVLQAIIATFGPSKG